MPAPSHRNRDRGGGSGLIAVTDDGHRHDARSRPTWRQAARHSKRAHRRYVHAVVDGSRREGVRRSRRLEAGPCHDAAEDGTDREGAMSSAERTEYEGEGRQAERRWARASGERTLANAAGAPQVHEDEAPSGPSRRDDSWLALDFHGVQFGCARGRPQPRQAAARQRPRARPGALARGKRARASSWRPRRERRHRRGLHGSRRPQRQQTRTKIHLSQSPTFIQGDRSLCNASRSAMARRSSAGAIRLAVIQVTARRRHVE